MNIRACILVASTSSYTRQCIPLYNVQCGAQIDAFVYNVLCVFSIASAVLWLLF